MENSTFEKIYTPKKFDAPQGEKSFVQIREGEVQSPETALLSEVVDSQHRCKRQMVREHIDRHERSRPIVNVQNLQ